MGNIIHISQPGRVVGRSVKLGEMVLEDGKPTVKLTRKSVKLGEGVELSDGVPPVRGCVGLSVTAEAAKRLGWAHPANQPKHSPRDIERLRGMIGNEAYGEGEQEEAGRVLAEYEAGRG